ncbi:MAG: RNA polymerase factor sigma-54 [Gemmatimonadetes bacterium]|nr:RNA polymerase factor sigma-54 [Gemmatimonadota bacterium]
MKTSLQQSTVLRQDLRMNPRLYQAMDLLYMPLLDLQQHLKTELETNPFLEMLEPDEEEAGPDAKTEKQEATENDEQAEADWEKIILDGFQVGASRGEFEESEFSERVRVQATGLDDYLRDQLQMLDLTDRQRLLAEEFIGNIGEDGYLHATLEEIVDGVNKVVEAHREGPELAESEPDADGPAAKPFAEVPLFTVAEAEEMLRVIQQLDPPGIGARDLRECLLLQLLDANQQETLTYRLVHEAFDDLIAHRWSELARRYGLDPKAVQDAADQLAKLDPKPGLRFLPTDDAYVMPDLVVQKIDGEYRVFLNDTAMPRLRISKVYQELAGDKKKFVGENRDFVTQKLNSASWLIQAIEQRRQTMLKVMNFIVDRQREFFDKGVEYLKPLTLREVADVIHMHESTVSRVTNQKYVQTPRGVLPLKFFFSSSLGTTTGEDASARAVKAQIAKLVGDESVGTPLTDSEIVAALKAKGIQIARRTVAKYRDQLGILPARMRKRV